MSKNQQSIDGFVARRNDSSRIGNEEAHRKNAGPGAPADEVGKPRMNRQLRADKAAAAKSTGILKSDIDASLRDIDEEQPRKAKHPHRLRNKRIIKWVIIAIIAILLAIGGYVAVKAIMASGSIFKGGLVGLVQQKPLKTDENGRTNVLVLGTSGSVDDERHPGALLTDSLMVLSIDQKKKNAYMVSIPRDLYVKYDYACAAGYEGKINALYECRSDGGKNEGAGASALSTKVGEVLGVSMQYYLHVNWEVLQESVEAVGGVDVKIESDDPRGILDRNFDWTCQYKCYMVKYKNGEVAHLDGAHALALARARNDAGGYGLSKGNFDREQNQQKILKALREKALSAGTLTNVGKVTALLDSLGKNLRTDFETSEIRTLMDLAKDIPSDKIQSISLIDEENPVVTTGTIGGASIVQPVGSLYNYSSIHKYIAKKLSDDGVSKEAAQVDVYNASGVAGVAKTESTKLEGKNFTVGVVDNAPSGDYGKVAIYQVGTGNAATKQALEQLYGTKVKTSAPPLPVSANTKFVVIIGQAPQSQDGM
jgi:LCP family protein required for cell wall assembly